MNHNPNWSDSKKSLSRKTVVKENYKTYSQTKDNKTKQKKSTQNTAMNFWYADNHMQPVITQPSSDDLNESERWMEQFTN
jgi:hypothetical protein